MNRPLLVSVATAAAVLLVAGCGSETAGAGPASDAASAPGPSSSAAAPSPAPAPTAVPAAAVPTEIPDGFDLARGLSADSDSTLTGPGPRVDGLSFEDLCGTHAWPGSGTTDRLATRLVAPEYEAVRELTTYADADSAAAVVDGLTEAVAACPENAAVNGAAGDERIFTTLDADTGYESSLTFALTYRVGLGGGIFQVVRVGSAVLATVETGEFAPETIDQGIPVVTRHNRAVTGQMCAWTEAGCGGEAGAEVVTTSPVLTADGVGPFHLGMSAADLVAEGGPQDADQADPCSPLEWTVDGATLHGLLSPGRGLVLLGVDGGVLPSGIRVGSTHDEVRAAHPDLVQGDNGVIGIPVGRPGGVAASYDLVLDDQQRVSELTLVADAQDCVG